MAGPVTENAGVQLQFAPEVPPNPVNLTPSGTGSVILIVVPAATGAPSFFTVKVKAPVPAVGPFAKSLWSETSIFLLAMKAMVMVEISPGATVTVEIWASRLQAPCCAGGIVVQPDMALPVLGSS